MLIESDRAFRFINSRSRSKGAGQVLVEAAISITLMITIAFGVLYFAIFLYLLALATAAAQAGAQEASRICVLNSENGALDLIRGWTGSAGPPTTVSGAPSNSSSAIAKILSSSPLLVDDSGALREPIQITFSYPSGNPNYINCAISIPQPALLSGFGSFLFPGTAPPIRASATAWTQMVQDPSANIY